MIIILLVCLVNTHALSVHLQQNVHHVKILQTEGLLHPAPVKMDIMIKINLVLRVHILVKTVMILKFVRLVPTLLTG